MTIPVFQSAEPPSLSLEERATANWELYREGIIFLAIRRLGDRAAAEDIAQEALLRAIKAFNDPQREPIVDRAAFLHGIARHLIIDAQRERLARPHLSIGDSLAAEHPDALAALIGKETRRKLVNALRQVSAADRKLLRLAFVNGLKSPEIAAALGESDVGIRKRKSRLIDRLRSILKED